MDSLTLQDALVFLTTGGASVAAYWLINRLPRTWWCHRSKGNRRLMSFVLTWLIADAAWWIQVVMGYQAAPASRRELLEALFLAGSTAAGLAQIIHGYLKPPEGGDEA